MARNNDRDRGKKRAPARDTARRGKPKICIFCRDRYQWVDYKDVNVLRRFISDRAKIKARRTTGTCVQHQRDVAVAIKTARELALIPYTQRTVSDKAGGREGRGRMGPRPPRPAGDGSDIPVAEGVLDVDGDGDAGAPDDLVLATSGDDTAAE
jgi:small subunit ribosomal protein S18